jgi:hypothetical protein
MIGTAPLSPLGGVSDLRLLRYGVIKWSVSFQCQVKPHYSLVVQRLDSYDRLHSQF